MNVDFRQVRDARELAVVVVRRLRESGHEALWAGGCVRDQLLGREPQDYDVATDARPEEVRRIFGHGRTIGVGAQFGVIAVIGPRRIGNIEVATFREDAQYSDGRHPDSVRFATAREDALRRDFTINGMFYDPLDDRLVDFVEGQQDLELGLIRAIGDPHERIAEDRLRMLRAVRFAAVFDFHIDDETLAAVRTGADRITVVSPERIAAEMRKVLAHPRRARGMELLAQSRLMPHILAPAVPGIPGELEGRDTPWQQSLGVLKHLASRDFATALAGFLFPFVANSQPAEQLGRQWRLSNAEREHAVWLLDHVDTARRADTVAWPQLQRVLIQPGATELINLAAAIAAARGTGDIAIDHCRAKMGLPDAELNPPPLLDGSDLKRIGLAPGPQFRVVLEAVRDAQLLGEINDREAAIAWVEDNRRSTTQF